MAFKYADWFPKEPNIGYETLIYDVMMGDQTLFNRADMVEETWRVVAERAGSLVEGEAGRLSELRVRKRWPGRGGRTAGAHWTRLASGGGYRRVQVTALARSGQRQAGRRAGTCPAMTDQARS